MLVDEKSGLRIIRLTHHSCISTNLYFEMCSFTADARYVLLMSQRGAGRDAPWDLFRARTDGMELVQMTEVDAMGGIVFSPETGAAYYAADRRLHKIDVPTFDEEIVAELPGPTVDEGYSLGTVDSQGRMYFTKCRLNNEDHILVRVDLNTGKVAQLERGGDFNHLHVDPAGTTLHFNQRENEQWRSYLIDADGSNLRKSPFDRFAHHTWFGTTGKMQGTLLPPGRGLAVQGENDSRFTMLAAGHYFWHSAPSSDTQWVVSDTNWPDEGVQLLHVPSGRVTYVCDAKSSCSHPQWTHPHPSLSPEMRYVSFNSDRTGIGQVYLVELTEEFLAGASAAER